MSSSRRDFLVAVGAVAGTTVLGVQKRRAASGGEGLPNVLILHTDQLSSWALSSYAPRLKATPNYGRTLVQTPHIDRIGREGALLTSFFTNSAVCTPSRGCLFTGRYPHSHGAHTNNIELKRDEITLARVLKRHGYETGYSGKWHLDGPPKPGFMKPERSMGFDDCRYMFNRGHWKKISEDEAGNASVSEYQVVGDAKTYTTDWLAGKTIEFIGRARRRPFLYVVSFPDPHTPFTVREPYMSMYRPQDMPLPRTAVAEPGRAKKGGGRSEEFIRTAKARYCGLVKCIDDNVGRILGALEERGILDRTIVVFTTDHGEYMGEHGLWGKNQWYRTAYQVPFLVRWPGGIKANTVVERFVTTVDVQQTLLGLMGLAPCGREQGRDASPLLRGEKAAWEDIAYIHHSSLRAAGIFTPEWEVVLKDNGQHMLFNRTEDPEQTRNQAESPECSDTFGRLKARLIEHHRSLASPASTWLEAPGTDTGDVAEPGPDGVVFRVEHAHRSTLSGGGKGWTRVIESRRGTLKADREYMLAFDFESRGLSGEDSFFYFTLRPGNDRKAQYGPVKWLAAKGEKGHKEFTFSTRDRADFVLIVGIYGTGDVVLRDLVIKQVSSTAP